MNWNLLTHIDHWVLRGSLWPLHSSFDLDLLPWSPFISHHQLSVTNSVRKPLFGFRIEKCDKINLQLTCGSSTAPCRCQTRVCPCPPPPRSPGRTAARAIWSGSEHCSFCPHWRKKKKNDWWEIDIFTINVVVSSFLFWNKNTWKWMSKLYSTLKHLCGVPYNSSILTWFG